MKILPIVLTCFALYSPINSEKVGNLIEENKISTVKICSDGKLCRENIEIIVASGEEKIVVEPYVNIGYNPQIFVASFTENELDEVLYTIEQDDKIFCQLFSFYERKATCIFDSSNFKPTIDAEYIDNDIIKINYNGKNLYLNNPSSESCNHDDCLLHISEVVSVSPIFNQAQNKYYIEVLQSVYGGYEANTFGYICSHIEVNEDGYNIISVGTTSNKSF